MDRNIPARPATLPLEKLTPAIACLVFALIALVLIPYPGIQNDEVFFANPIYSPDSTFYSIQLGFTRIPVMVMSYSGALKTWIYEGLWGYLFDPSEWSLRLPAVLAGIGTILLTWAFTRRVAGLKAAAITTVLLATDTCFQLTNTFDWGPVAMQHLLLMGGLLCCLQWVQGAKAWTLLLGGFLWGLGLWDKALLIWPLIGMSVATLAIYPLDVFRRARSWAVLGAIATFLLGAAPLVWYNIDKPGATATTNANFEFKGVLPGKLRILADTANGSALFGYMVRPNWAPNPRQPITAIEKASVAVTRLIGEHQRNWIVYGFLAALAIGFVLQTRVTAWLFLTILVAWIQMLITKNTGAAAHHDILLWPFPLIVMGVAFASIPARAANLLVGVLVIQNLLTTNEYVSEFARFGPTVNWTDAIYKLSDSVTARMATDIEIVDWGYLNGIRLLHEGDLPLRIATDPLIKPELGETERSQIGLIIDSPDRIFITHTTGNQIFPGLNEKLLNTAAQLGYRKKLIKTVSDRNGRPIFDLFRFEKTSGGLDLSPNAVAEPLVGGRKSGRPDTSR